MASPSDTPPSDNTSSSSSNPLSQWFPTGQNDSSGWRLDVVTLLAVIGESSVAEHSQAITASFLCLLPRIIPAPQALLKPSRPMRLPEVRAKTAGVYNGVVLDSVGFFADILHPLDQLHPFEFKVLEITHTDLNEAGGIGFRRMFRRTRTRRGSGEFDRQRRGSRLTPGPLPEANEASNGKEREKDTVTRTGTLATGASGNVTFETKADNDPEIGGVLPQPGVRRRETVSEKMTDYLVNPTLANTEKRPAVPATLYSPVHVLSFLSFLLSLALVGTAVYWKDGTAIVAVGAISVASSVVGYASWWQPMLMNRSHTNQVPRGDVVIRTREGAFVLIRCTEEVARELYSGTEECMYYVSERSYPAYMGIGTVMLMISVVLLGNCNWNSQVFIGASYITLNGLYWAMGLLPREYFWDMSRYKCEDKTPQDAKDAHTTTNPDDPREGVKSYTRTLWYAIRETRRTGWVERSGAAPGTKQWREWLQEADRAAKKKQRNWPSVQRKDEIMRNFIAEERDCADTEAETDGEAVDMAEQHAPLIEVQPRTMSGRLDSSF
ncbi:hypothetical protein BR93DRAFT_883519 [Coniochaeta sp. PMI_546]|nr:hypothetical protein BR93DRAFT_883519 [Coniochaeta sp. PMI_546]